MRSKEIIIRKVAGSMLMGALPNFMSGLSSLFALADNHNFDKYMRGNIVDDWKSDWQTIGNDIKTAMGNYKATKEYGHRK